MTDPVAHLKAHSAARARYTTRLVFWVPEWMKQACRDIAHQHGVSEADVARECLTHGLRVLFGKEAPK